jgi:hypothetical protein
MEIALLSSVLEKERAREKDRERETNRLAVHHRLQALFEMRQGGHGASATKWRGGTCC